MGYASNRGHDSIAVLAVGEEDGALSLLACQLTSTFATAASCQPAQWPPRDCPRDFSLCGKNGKWVVVANQDSDSIVVFDRDILTGLLSPTGIFVPCPAPVCIVPV